MRIVGRLSLLSEENKEEEQRTECRKLKETGGNEGVREDFLQKEQKI